MNANSFVDYMHGVFDAVGTAGFTQEIANKVLVEAMRATYVERSVTQNIQFAAGVNPIDTLMRASDHPMGGAHSSILPEDLHGCKQSKGVPLTAEEVKARVEAARQKALDTRAAS
jgi:hypothetical protein